MKFSAIHSLAVAAISAIAVAPLADAALVAHFAFEGSSADSLVGGYTGTLAGDPQFVSTGLAAVPSGTTQAIEFDGAGDWVQTSYQGIAGSATRSIALWVKTATINGNQSLVAWGDSNGTPGGEKWHFRLNENAGNGALGGLRTEIQGSYEIDGSGLADGDWHHVVSVYDAGGPFGDGNGRVRHYVDGVQVENGAGDTGGDTVTVNTVLSATIAGTAAPVLLGGRRQTATTTSLTGLLDEIRIYDHALSLSEVEVLAGIPEPSSVGLIGFGALFVLRRRRR